MLENVMRHRTRIKRKMTAIPTSSIILSHGLIYATLCTLICRTGLAVAFHMCYQHLRRNPLRSSIWQSFPATSRTT